MRLKLVRDNTSIDFFAKARIWLGISLVMMVVGLFLRTLVPLIPLIFSCTMSFSSKLDV